MPVIYDAALEAKNPTTTAISLASPKRPMGMWARISSVTAAALVFLRLALLAMIASSRSVRVAPGRTLLTVIPCDATSRDRVFAHDATAARTVFETPSPAMGMRTEVEMMLIMRPN